METTNRRTIFNVDSGGRITKSNSGPPPPPSLRTWFHHDSKSTSRGSVKVVCLAMDGAFEQTVNGACWFPYKICHVTHWPGKQVRCYAGFNSKSHCLHYYKDMQKLLDVMWKYITTGYPTNPPDLVTCGKEKKVYFDFLRKVVWFAEKWEATMVPYDVRQFYDWVLERLGTKPKLHFHPLPRIDASKAQKMDSTFSVTSNHHYDVQGMVGKNFDMITSGNTYSYLSTKF